ncbi:hypothetical protein STSP2_03286 [Anaerohalosphaera lusitana]|uniref:YgjP-like metallopeptidase domain-containing protein n=1 Tax=Anaerohalosphaera lusitana TaxID=1936003 RepID=A0A1U9NQS2_9BACT|nr:SprT family zinc-dependent metalloprotease [Anaerohalosphaera lusitana]AQT70084.1 hypothetical protein STSP2_03286 [Anaerohalosphaera lusitana]
MTTERYDIEIRGLAVQVVRKDIKNLHVGVYPPDGRIRVAAPEHLSREAIRLAVVSRLGWIKRQQQSFHHQVRQSQREMVTGESHYFQGRRYRLDVVEHDGPAEVALPNNTTMELRIRPGTSRERRQEVLNAWYRDRLKEQVPALLEKWQGKVGVVVRDWRIRKMKTRWGSCNAEAGRIWLNLELAKKETICLEYILVHEMVHLIERHHDERFIDLMDKLMPQWRLHRDRLNQSPLAHEDWSY